MLLDHPLTTEHRDILLGNAQLWQERLEGQPNQDIDRTLAIRIKDYLENERIRVVNGDLSTHQYDSARVNLNHFQQWFGPKTIDAIDEDCIEGYWRHLSQAEIAVESRIKRQIFAHSLIKYLAEKKLIPLPSNINSKRFKFKKHATIVPNFTHEEIHKLLEASSGQVRLHILLMLNCGMYQNDISELVQSEVDWKKGTITRRRSKTKDRKSKDIPTVTYKLWRCTFDLLKQYRQETGDIVLLTERGNRWVSSRLENGILKRADNHHSTWVNLVKKTGIRKASKLLRKTAASTLDNHPEYGREMDPKNWTAG